MENQYQEWVPQEWQATDDVLAVEWTRTLERLEMTPRNPEDNM